MSATATDQLAGYRLLIGGHDVDAASGETFEALNPTTGQPWAQVALAAAEDVDRAVSAARAAFEDERWRGLSPTRRGRLLMRLFDLIAERAEETQRSRSQTTASCTRRCSRSSA
ncbi:MAG: aldehyde dehydrogenase family protein [Gaiellaceae bacterium]